MTITLNIKTAEEATNYLSAQGFDKWVDFRIHGRAYDGNSLNFIDGMWELARTERSGYEVIARIPKESDAYRMLVSEVMVGCGRWK